MNIQELRRMSKEELKQKAGKMNLPMTDNMSQDELITMIAEADQNDDEDLEDKAADKTDKSADEAM